MTPDIALAACRFLHDAAAMMLWGAFAYVWAFVPSPLSGHIASRLAVFRLVAVAVAAVTTIVALPIQTAVIGDGWPDALNRQMLSDVISATSAGEAWFIQGAAAILLVVAQAAPPSLRPAATAVMAGLLLAGLASSGHALMQGGGLGVMHQANDVVHVLSAGGWVGALLPLLLILSRFERSSTQREAGISLHRFSVAGHVAVALAIVSGIVNTLFIVGWPLEWSTPYRLMLTAKIAVVLLMAIVAITNRYWFAPRIGRTDGAAVRAIGRGTLIEIALGLAAILLVSVFGMLDPN
jgi:putative copper resistance protein D